MRPEPRLSPDAQADVAYAIDYHNAQRTDLGFGFLDELERVISLIRDNPLLFTLVDAPVRRALLKRFPYGVFYVPGSSDESDVILAVVDLRQDPDVIRRTYRR